MFTLQLPLYGQITSSGLKRIKYYLTSVHPSIFFYPLLLSGSFESWCLFLTVTVRETSMDGLELLQRPKRDK